MGVAIVIICPHCTVPVAWVWEGVASNLYFSSQVQPTPVLCVLHGVLNVAPDATTG